VYVFSKNETIKDALPSDDDRKALEKDIKQVNKRIVEVENYMKNLVKAVAAGADTNLLLDEQN